MVFLVSWCLSLSSHTVSRGKASSWGEKKKKTEGKGPQASIYLIYLIGGERRGTLLKSLEMGVVGESDNVWEQLVPEHL